MQRFDDGRENRQHDQCDLDPVEKEAHDEDHHHHHQQKTPVAKGQAMSGFDDEVLAANQPEDIGKCGGPHKDEKQH